VLNRYRRIYAVGRPATRGHRSATRRRRSAASKQQAAMATVRAGREQSRAEDDYGRGDGGEQCDGRRGSTATGVGGRSGPVVPAVARSRRFVVGRTRTVDHAVAYGPGGQAQSLVARAQERALVVGVRRPPGGAWRSVRVPRQMAQLGPRNLEMRFVWISVSHKPDVHVAPQWSPPPRPIVVLLRFRAAHCRWRLVGGLFDVLGSQQRQIFERRGVVSARRHEWVVHRPGRQVDLQSAVLTIVRHEVHLRILYLLYAVFLYLPNNYIYILGH